MKIKGIGKKAARIAAVILSCVLPFTALTACSESEVSALSNRNISEYYVTTWGAAAFGLGVEYFPTDPPLRDNTLRQTAHISLGGDKFTFTFSNEYGASTLEIDKVYISKLLTVDDGTVDTSTNTVLTFNGGSESVSISPGEAITSDEVNFSCEALENIAVSIEFGGNVPVKTTGHEFANTSAFIAEGKCGDAEILDIKKVVTCSYFLTKINVLAKDGEGAVVCLGDSITDGVGSDENGFNDYPSMLAQLFQSDESTSKLAVVNEGIGGNKFADNSCVGPCGLDRFERDALNVDGVKYVLLFIGANDVGAADENTFAKMTAGYEQIAQACHEKGIKLYAATITPIKKSGYDSDYNRQILEELNTYILSEESVFDGVIDFYSAVEDQSESGTIADEYNCPWNDYLHLGAKGYEKLAQTAFEFFKENVVNE